MLLELPSSTGALLIIVLCNQGERLCSMVNSCKKARVFYKVLSREDIRTEGGAVPRWGVLVIRVHPFPHISRVFLCFRLGRIVELVARWSAKPNDASSSPGPSNIRDVGGYWLNLDRLSKRCAFLSFDKETLAYRWDSHGYMNAV